MAYYNIKRGGKKKYNAVNFVIDVALISVTRGLWIIWVILRWIFSR